MKLNLQIELDWIDEEMNLDETVKQNIINSVTNQIRQGVENQVKGAIDKIIGETTVKKIDELTENLFNDFMNQPVTINDSYGSKINVYPNVTAIIKERFDNFMTQKVDDQGRTSTSSYDAKYQRLTFIIDKQLKDFAKTFTDDAVKKVSSEIRLHVQDGLTTKLGNELMKVLKINEMLTLPSKS